MPEAVATVGIVGDRQGSADTLRDAMTRLGWALDERVRLIVSREPAESHPKWAAPAIADIPQVVERGDPNRADLILLAEASGLRWARSAMKAKVLITDPAWYSTVEVDRHAALSSLGVTEEEWAGIDARSQQQFVELLSRHEGAHKVAVYGTGPSMTTVEPEAVAADVTIACNSAVSNLEWIERARPALVVFADPVFHFGPSRYAGAFRDDLLRVAGATDATFAFPRRFAPLVLRRIPELRDRMIAVGPRTGLPLDSLFPNHLHVPQTANVLTMMMLPFAAALGSETVIAGCDGRRPDERYFWNHSADAQYDGSVMSSAFAAHPSFFRDRDYVSYYETHCDQLESMLAEAEAGGLRFRSITHSEIPALQKRSP